jgi:prefoldin beta subunit
MHSIAQTNDVAELSKLQSSRTQYMTQSNENDMVKKVAVRISKFTMQELELLESDAEVFKLIGPALIRQEKSEAISNVSKRLEFILTEL